MFEKFRKVILILTTFISAVLNPKFSADDNLKFCCFFKNNKQGMLFHEYRLPADSSHEMSHLILF